MLPPGEPEKMHWRQLFPDIQLFKKKKIAGFVPTAITQETTASQIIRDAELNRLKRFVNECTKCNPRLAVLFAGIGGVSFALAIIKGVESSNSKTEISYRKEQLNKPQYELTGSESINFPWDQHNLKEWLYRPVKITGRPLHNKAMLVPRVVDGYNGFDYIVPLVTKENEDGSEQEGILLNKGWLPHEYEHIGARWRIENALPQTFECYLSLNSELDEKSSFFKEGNAPSKLRNRWGHVYLPDMAQASGLKNTGVVKLALLEKVNMKSALDERLPKHFDVNLPGSEDHPYQKTRAGALQLKEMPWNLQADQNCYLTLGTLFTGLAVALKFLH